MGKEGGGRGLQATVWAERRAMAAVIVKRCVCGEGGDLVRLWVRVYLILCVCVCVCESVCMCALEKGGVGP